MKKELMSDEVVDSNPYSRLMALKRMGIVENYENIAEYTIVIVGVGGVGSTTAEMLVRCGIGKLVLFDYDKIEMANMNRLFYKPKHCGMAKVEAAKSTLTKINPLVEIDTYCINITSIDNFNTFLQTLQKGGKNKTKVNLLLCCVDNYQARMTVNSACNELNMPWFESGVSENAVSGHIQLIQPGLTPCYACMPPLLVASNIDEQSLKRDGVCAASLPTTMAIIAGIMVQNVLKYLLKFGNVSNYVGYNALSDYFHKLDLKSNPECIDHHCRRIQIEMAESITEPVEKCVKNIEKITRSDNIWGIEIVKDDISTVFKEIPQTIVN